MILEAPWGPSPLSPQEQIATAGSRSVRWETEKTAASEGVAVDGSKKTNHGYQLLLVIIIITVNQQVFKHV